MKARVGTNLRMVPGWVSGRARRKLSGGWVKREAIEKLMSTGMTEDEARKEIRRWRELLTR